MEGITAFLIDLQLAKANELIDVTDDGISISSKDVQPLKLYFPIDDNEDGNFILLICSKRKNPLSSIVFNNGGNITFLTDMQLIKEWLLIVVIDEGRHISVNEEHSTKQNGPIDVTDEGIDIYFNFFASLKSNLPILVTDGGI